MDKPFVKSNIGFWMNRPNVYVSAATGLLQEEIDILQSFKVGDQLVLFMNGEKKTERSPDASLRKSVPYTPKPREVGEDIPF
jgi:hypothetical protein